VTVKEEAGPPRQDEGATRGTRWNASSSTSRRWSLGQAGSARSGGIADAKRRRKQDPSTEEEDNGKQSPELMPDARF
jgi:hypothetical protein